MHATGPYNDELPELPIPRPGEARSTPPAAASPPLNPPRLGASFTAASTDAGPSGAAQGSVSDREQLESERFIWELAARLTAGMLANPVRSTASVKDAMGVFDQFLQEMQVYTRIASKVLHEDERRREHGEYFHRAQEQMTETVASDAPAAKSEPTLPRPRPMGT